MLKHIRNPDLRLRTIYPRSAPDHTGHAVAFFPNDMLGLPIGVNSDSSSLPPIPRRCHTCRASRIGWRFSSRRDAIATERLRRTKPRQQACNVESAMLDFILCPSIAVMRHSVSQTDQQSRNQLMKKVLQLGINGAAGRMGQRVIALASVDKELNVTAGYEWSASDRLGYDVGELSGVGALGVILTAEIGKPVDVVIDFSTPEGCMNILDQCAARSIPLVVATTGLTLAHRTRVAQAAQTIPILMAPSMSLAVNIAMKLVADSARALKNHSTGVDVEIVERHHRFKQDAPSGTALKFGEIVAQIMGQEKQVHGREGQTGERQRNEIGYHALRVGDNVGEHTIVFGMLGETLEVTVRGQSRDSYAAGSLTAAKYLATKTAGLYTMADALGL